MSSSSCSFIPTSALPPCLAQRKYPSFILLHENVNLLGISCSFALSSLALSAVSWILCVSSSVLFSLDSYCMLLPGCMGLWWWCLGPLSNVSSQRQVCLASDVSTGFRIEMYSWPCDSNNFSVPLSFFHLFNPLLSINQINTLQVAARVSLLTHLGL